MCRAGRPLARRPARRPLARLLRSARRPQPQAARGRRPLPGHFGPLTAGYESCGCRGRPVSRHCGAADSAPGRGGRVAPGAGAPAGRDRRVSPVSPVPQSGPTRGRQAVGRHFPGRLQTSLCRRRRERGGATPAPASGRACGGAQRGQGSGRVRACGERVGTSGMRRRCARQFTNSRSPPGILRDRRFSGRSRRSGL